MMAVLCVAAGQNNDRFLPEDICPCQLEATCMDDRHVFGTDVMDIERFGVIGPCAAFGYFPCCPAQPPPPREVKLTAQDLQGFSQEELVQLGVINKETGTIGSSSLPLAHNEEQARLLAQQRLLQQQPAADLNQLGAASLAPALGGAAKPGASSAPPLPGNMKQQSMWLQQVPSGMASAPQWPVQSVMHGMSYNQQPMYLPMAHHFYYAPRPMYNMYRPKFS